MKYLIEVSVEPEFMQEHSEPNHYVFAYHVCIRNEGEQAAQLLGRQWIITDSDGDITEVQGEGVIGVQPLIQPQCEHRYSSFSVLKTPVGCMQGFYQMCAEDGTFFEAEIPTFTLAVKGFLQ